MAAKRETPGGLQSLDTALHLLKVLSEFSGPAALSELARAAGMPPSKAHRYLASFQAAGLVEQAGRSAKYDLGPAALELGLAALARHDFVNRVSDMLPDLAASTGLTVLLSVWGNAGATVIRWHRAPSPVITSMGLGTTLPLLTSASGRAFLAWAPPGQVAAQMASELALAQKNPDVLPDLPPTKDAFGALSRQIRADGYAAVDGRFIPGLVAVAAPVLDWQDQAQAVVTLIGTDPAIVAPGSDAVRTLLAFCARHGVPVRESAVRPATDEAQA